MLNLRLSLDGGGRKSRWEAGWGDGVGFFPSSSWRCKAKKINKEKVKIGRSITEPIQVKGGGICYAAVQTQEQ